MIDDNAPGLLSINKKDDIASCYLAKYPIPQAAFRRQALPDHLITHNSHVIISYLITHQQRRQIPRRTPIHIHSILP